MSAANVGVCESGSFKMHSVYHSLTLTPSNRYHQKEFKAAEAQFYRLCKRDSIRKIFRVDNLTNPKLEEKFEQRKIDLKETGYVARWMFHRSRNSNYQAIAEHGSVLDQVANGRKFGNGVYVTEQA